MIDKIPNRNAKPVKSKYNRMIIVSNRLPITVEYKENEFIFKESVGGLVSGISAYLDSLKGSSFTQNQYLWLGWPGVSIVDEDKRTELKSKIYATHNAFPVFLSEEEMEKFYQGFCNKTIWPLFHSFPSYVSYDENSWKNYRIVNEIFCNAVLAVIKPGDLIWIHDYHLLLLPGLLREKLPNASIGFFLHIPFPSFETFRLLPKTWREEILLGLLGADLIGFHTYSYCQYFLRCVFRILGYDQSMGEITTGDRIVKAETFPMGIDFKKFNDAAISPEVEREKNDIGKNFAGKKVILSIDRLDYSKGIINRIEGYENFLEQNPQWHKRAVLFLVVVPSRIGVDQYQTIKKRIDELVGEINGRFGSADWTPIFYQYKYVPFHQLVALYGISDIALITPLRDGMNLIAKEYVAGRPDKTGVLVLSEMAGAAEELREAVIINPNNREEIAEVLKEVLQMPPEEQKRRNETMQHRLAHYDVIRWAADFLAELSNVKEIQDKYATHLLQDTIKGQLKNRYKKSKHALIFLDYDGTLLPFTLRPQLAKPTEQVTGLLKRLTANSATELVLTSGRDRHSIGAWFDIPGLNFIAEHGTWIKEKGNEWRLMKPLTSDWISQMRPIIEVYVDRLPGSFIEQKDYSIVWHYRGADQEMAPLLAKELIDNLIGLTANMDLQVLQGSKVVEIRNAGINKGTAALYWLNRNSYDFKMAVGDDWTDEDLFKILLDHDAYTIKVGIPPSYAHFYVRGYKDILALLADMTA